MTFPKCVFKADSRSATSNDNRVFDDWGFHDGHDEKKLASQPKL
jgi:hypothetical protein